MQENLEYLDKWETLLSEHNITKEHFLTRSTAERLRVSITSTIELTTFLLHNCKYDHVLTSKLNQDPLEVVVLENRMYDLHVYLRALHEFVLDIY